MNQFQKKFYLFSLYNWFLINIYYFINNNLRIELVMYNVYIYVEVEERIDIQQVVVKLCFVSQFLLWYSFVNSNLGS